MIRRKAGNRLLEEAADIPVLVGIQKNFHLPPQIGVLAAFGVEESIAILLVPAREGVVEEVHQSLWVVVPDGHREAGNFLWRALSTRIRRIVSAKAEKK